MRRLFILLLACSMGLISTSQCTAELDYLDDSELIAAILIACQLTSTGCNNTVLMDTSFSDDGIVTLNNSNANGDDSAFEFDFDSQNRITLGGSSVVANGTLDSLIVRLLDDGSLDTSLSGSGGSTQDTSGTNNSDYIHGLLMDNNDKIVVTGPTKPSTTNDFFIGRLNADGTYDTSFNGTGLRRINNVAGGNAIDAATGVALDSSNRLMVVGHSAVTTSPIDIDHVMTRLTSAGATDTSFGTSGVARIPSVPLWDTLVSHSMAIDSNGSIVFAGQRNNGTDNVSNTNYDMAVYRLTSTGVADTSFNGTGFQIVNGTAGGNGNDVAYDLVIDSSNRVYVAGASYNGSNFDAVVWAFDSDGTALSAFGNGGAAVLTDNGDDDVARAIVLDKQNRVVVCGGTKLADGTVDLIAWRLTEAGLQDTTFSGGQYQHNSAAGGNGDDICNDLAFDSSDRLVIAGSSYNGSNADVAVWRLLVQ